MNPYEEARERLERANQAHRELVAIKAALENVQYLVQAVGRRDPEPAPYETTPGIPLPEWREQVQA